jgi:hypothetical protein
VDSYDKVSIIWDCIFFCAALFNYFQNCHQYNGQIIDNLSGRLIEFLGADAKTSLTVIYPESEHQILLKITGPFFGPVTKMLCSYSLHWQVHRCPDILIYFWDFPTINFTCITKGSTYLSGASFTKLTYVSDVIFGNCLLVITHNFVL